MIGRLLFITGIILGIITSAINGITSSNIPLDTTIYIMLCGIGIYLLEERNANLS